MYCIIIYNEGFLYQGSKTQLVDKTLYINPDCPMKILIDYIRSTIGLTEELEFDLCTMDGELKNIHTYEDAVYGTTVFDPFRKYVCVLTEKNEDGNFSKITPLMSGTSLISKLNKKYIPWIRKSNELKSHNFSRKSINKSTSRKSTRPKSQTQTIN